MSGIPNLGTAGSVLDAVNTGLVRVEGPAVWLGGESVNNYVATPPIMTQLLSLYGDFTITVQVGSPLDFSQSGYITFYNHMASAISGGTSLRIIGGSGRTPQFLYSSGGAYRSATGGVLSASAVGLKCKVDSKTLPQTVTFYQSLDMINWTTLGAPVTIESNALESLSLPASFIVGRNYGDGKFLGTLKLFLIEHHDGRIALQIGPKELSNIDLNDTQIVSGDEDKTVFTIYKSSEGPTTTLLSEQSIMYVNPKVTGANIVNSPDSDVFTVSPNESFLLSWCGYLTNIVVGNRFISTKNSGVNGIWINTSSLTSASGYVYANNIMVGSEGLNGSEVIPSNRKVVFFFYGNRVTNKLSLRIFDEKGLVGSTTPVNYNLTEYDVDPIGGITAGVCSGGSAPMSGGISSYSWVKGVAIDLTDQRLAIIARRLLANASRPARSTTGALPPTGHKVYGDRYRANNGHIAFFNGVEWEAVTPLTGNIAAILGNNQLLLGAS